MFASTEALVVILNSPNINHRSLNTLRQFIWSFKCFTMFCGCEIAKLSVCAPERRFDSNGFRMELLIFTDPPYRRMDLTMKDTNSALTERDYDLYNLGEQG